MYVDLPDGVVAEKGNGNQDPLPASLVNIPVHLSVSQRQTMERHNRKENSKNNNNIVDSGDGSISALTVEKQTRDNNGGLFITHGVQTVSQLASQCKDGVKPQLFL